MSHYKSGIKMKSSSGGYVSVSEIEELSKRIERLGRNSTENYTPVDSTCLSGQPSNLKNGSFSSAVRSNQHNGNDKVQTPESCMFYPLPTGNKPMMNRFKISRLKEEDIDAVVRGINGREYLKKLECQMKEFTEGKVHYNTSEHESNLKNLSKAEPVGKVVQLENKIQNLLITRYNLTDHDFTTFDSRTKGGQPSNLLNGSFSTANRLEQHHGRKKCAIREKCKRKPYHKLTWYERLNQWHIRRAEEDNFKLFVAACAMTEHEGYIVNSSEDEVGNIVSCEKIDCNGVEKLEMENAFKNDGK